MLLHLQPYVLRRATAHGILQSNKRTDETVERLHMQRARMDTNRRRIKKNKIMKFHTIMAIIIAFRAIARHMPELEKDAAFSAALDLLKNDAEEIKKREQ